MVVDTAGRLGHPPADRRGDDVARARGPPAGARPPSPARPAPSYRIAPSPRTASLTSACWPAASGPRPHHRRVELHELDVAHGEPGAQGDRHAVAGDRRRVRRRGEHLPVAAGGERRPPAPRTTPTDCDVAVGVEQGDRDAGRLAARRRRRADDEVEGEGALEHLDAGRHRRLVERALHLGAAAVAAGVDDAVVAVPALAGERRRRRPPSTGRTPRRGASGSGSPSAPRRPARARPPRRTARRRRPACRARGSRTSRSGSSTPARPPWAHAVEPASSVVLGDDQHAAHRARTASAAASPAAPEPTHDDVDVALPRDGCGRAASAVGRRAHRRRRALLAGRRRGADGDHPLDRRPGPARRCRRARRPRRVPSRSERSSLAGVIIFMYLQTAARLTGSNITSGLALRQLVEHPGLGGDEHLRRGRVAARASTIPLVDRILVRVLRHDAGADEVERARRAAALGVDEQLGVRVLGRPAPSARRR